MSVLLIIVNVANSFEYLEVKGLVMCAIFCHIVNLLYRLYILDRSIYHFRGVGSILLPLFYFEGKSYRP